MLVLQICMEGETGNCSGTAVTCDGVGAEEVSMRVEDAIDIKEEFCITVEGAIDIKEEFSIKVEDAEDIKNEIPEPITFTPIKTEQEVRLWGVCVLEAARAFNLYILSIYGNLKGRCLEEVISINVRIILKHTFDWFRNMWTAFLWL